MSYNRLILVAAGGSLALLLGAWTFQYFGYAPCKMCIWQRYPHAIAFAIGGLALAYRHRAFAFLGALAALSTAAIAIFHSGVERGWWQGPASCTGNGAGLGGLSGADLLSTAGSANIVMCDEVAWALFGASMASWNAMFSLVLVILWLKAARKFSNPQN